MSTSATPAPWRAVVFGPYGRLTAGLLLSEISVAVQVLLLAAALPAVVRDLGGIQLYGWVVSASAIGMLLVTPIAGRAADRLDPVGIFGMATALVVAGLALSALAPTMAVVVTGRFLMGCGAAGQYALSLTRVARDMPAPIRARVFAVMSFGWLLPGLIGPAAGAFVASTVGWRWALAAPLPLVLASPVLLVPALRRGRGQTSTAEALGSVGWSAALALGVTLLLGALADPGLPALPVGALGAVLALAGLRRVLPSGTLLARAGLPAVIAAQFLVNLAYFAGDGFVPLALTRVLGRSLIQASVVLTMSSISWSLASWWQSRTVMSRSPRTLVAGGGLLIALGAASVLVSLLGGPVILPYLGWGIAGFGMGLAFQTTWVLGTQLASDGSEGSTVASILLAETVGLSLGAGIAGGGIALARAAAASLRVGLLGAFGLVALAALATALLAARLQPGAAAPEEAQDVG